MSSIPMTINLENFVDKEVIITLNGGKKAQTIIQRNSDSLYAYWCTIDGGIRSYTKDGFYDIEYDSPFNIESIQLKNSPKELNMTKLSNRTFQQLADTLTSDVIDYLHEDERYVLFMQEVIPDALSHLMGELDENLKCELSMAIMDRMALKQTNL